MINQYYLTTRFFIAMAVCIGLLVMSFVIPALYPIAWALFYFIGLISVWEGWTLAKVRFQLSANRKITTKLSLGDDQHIRYEVSNLSARPLIITLIDELPQQFQIRNFRVTHKTIPQQIWLHDEKVRPLVRGKYFFGDLHVYLSLPGINFIELRVTKPATQESTVYPSAIQMEKYALEVFSRTANLTGIRRVRTLGENDEFELIRNYQQGDNIRSINWKATSRKNHLMVNQFQNTRAQQVYCILDKGRSMKMPFAGLTLLDYAINTALVISNIILRKYDKAGLITFSDRIGQMVGAENMPLQLNLISEQLYAQITGFKESNFELLYHTLRSRLRRRSILLFFTNFEYQSDLDRHLPFLQSLNNIHLLVVIFFQNTELASVAGFEAKNLGDVYLKTFAQKALREKEIIQNKLQSYGIQTILTPPQDLSIQVINKYLEIKARRKS